MRSSSVKTLFVSAVAFAVVSATALTAEARPAQPSPSGAAIGRAIASVKAMQKKFVGIIDYIMIGPPLPAPASSTSTTSPAAPASAK